MDKQWFVIRGSKDLGPFSVERLTELASNGKLKPEDLVRRADLQFAGPANEIEGLFPSQAGSSSSPDGKIPGPKLAPPALRNVSTAPLQEPEWFYAKNGEQSGPLLTNDLKALAQSDILLPTDLVWKEGLAEWVPAESIAGLFSVTRAKMPPPLPVATGQTAPECDTKWYCDASGITIGPFSNDQIKRLVLENRLLPSDIVWKDGAARSPAVSHFPLLFPASETQTTRGHPSSTATSVVPSFDFLEPPPPLSSQAAKRSSRNIPVLVAVVCLGIVIGLLALKFASAKREITQIGEQVKKDVAKRIGNEARELKEQGNGNRIFDAPKVNVKPDATPGKRRLNVHIATAEGASSPWTNRANQCLANASAIASNSQLVIRFDTQGKIPPLEFRFLVRLFDKNGTYLTHFLTSEVFDSVPQRVDQANAAYERLGRNAAAAGWSKRILLEANGNEMVYPVSERDITFAEIIEIGFVERE